jgi:hypothetical protein
MPPADPKATFGLMVRALLADVPKKNSWGLAEHVPGGTCALIAAAMSGNALVSERCWRDCSRVSPARRNAMPRLVN